MNRILIDAETYQDILAKHPHIEVELLRTTVPMIAEMLKKKIQEKEGTWTQQIEKAIRRLEQELTSRWRFPSDAKAVIKSVMVDELIPTIRKELSAAVEAEAKAISKREVDKVVATGREQIRLDDAKARQQIDAYAKAAAEREVMALLRAGKMTVAP